MDNKDNKKKQISKKYEEITNQFVAELTDLMSEENINILSKDSKFTQRERGKINGFEMLAFMKNAVLLLLYRYKFLFV